jgi:hypothetical protein
MLRPGGCDERPNMVVLQNSLKVGLQHQVLCQLIATKRDLLLMMCFLEGLVFSHT